LNSVQPCQNLTQIKLIKLFNDCTFIRGRLYSLSFFICRIFHYLVAKLSIVCFIIVSMLFLMIFIIAIMLLCPIFRAMLNSPVFIFTKNFKAFHFLSFPIFIKSCFCTISFSLGVSSLVKEPVFYTLAMSLLF